MANVQKDVMLRTKATASIVINTALVLRFAISTKRNYITINSVVNILPDKDRELIYEKRRGSIPKFV